jgi:hypothetical protein
MNSDIRMMYNDTTGAWVCQTPRMLDPLQLRRVVNFTLSARSKMAVSMPRGERRERVEKAIEALRGGRVEQAILNDGRSETTLYAKD